MNEINIIDSERHTLPIELSYLFAQLAPQEVEQFYQCYRLWSLQHDIAAIQGQINELQQQIEHNAQHMQSVQPSPIALSALAQLQAYGVSDLDLLDRMLERGDTWLDHTVQLLVRCEELGVIRSNYTQWCENALEGAYDWITTMDQATSEPAASEPFDENIEITLIQKLMSEDETAPELPGSKTDSTDIADQATLLPANNATQSTTSPQSSADQTIVPSQPSAGTDLSCPPSAKGNQQNPNEDDQSLSTESDIIAEPDSSFGTTEAINLEDLKVPTTIQEDDLEANTSSITSNQSTEAIKQVDTPSSNLHNVTTETSKNFTSKQRDDTIYQFRSSSKATDNATSQHRDHIYQANDLSAEISNDSNISAESPTAIDNCASETTNPTPNHTEQATQQENDSEEQTATATIVATNTVTGRTVKNADQHTEQPEQTTTQVHLQEDDLALPPVTNTYKPSISWIEPVATTEAEHPEQTLQEATTTDHKPDISWSDKPIEPPQTPHKKQGGLLTRLFHPLNR